MVMVLEKHPLFMLLIKMVIAIFNEQFNSDSVIQNDDNIMQSADIHRCYRTAYYSISVLFNKIPFIVIFFCFAIPTLVIQSRHKNIILANNAGKALSVEFIFSKAEHHHFTSHIQRI